VAPTVEIVEFTDPACVWAWGNEPQLRWLRSRIGHQVAWRRAFGVQIDDLAASRPGVDPVADAEQFRSMWQDVAGHTAAPVPAALSWMHRSTRPMAAAAKAAERQGADVADRVLRRLREAVFVVGRPGDTSTRIADAVRGVPGLDEERLLADLAAGTVAAGIDTDWEEARRPRPEVFDLTAPAPFPGKATPTGDRVRYAFPTLVITGPAASVVVPGRRPLQAYLDALAAADPSFVADPGPDPTPDEALARYRTLTEAELPVLTDGSGEPTAAVVVTTPTARVWVHPDEAAVRDLPALEAAAG
jgi:predicted DsbA family dithiol-disulfide isomerase